MLSKSEIKYIQTLFQKKFRDAEKCYLIEGPKVVDEALKTRGVHVKKIMALEEWKHDEAIIPAKTEFVTISQAELKKISQLKTPHHVVAIVAMSQDIKEVRPAESIVVVLDGIQDPGNLGTIIRIADWFGVPQLICSRDSADVYNAKVVQAAMGSLFRVSVLYKDLSRWLSQQKRVPIWGASLNGVPLSKIHPITAGILVIGNESKGIRPEIQSQVTQKITIEKKGHAESLNAAIAAGIILSHLK